MKYLKLFEEHNSKEIRNEQIQSAVSDMIEGLWKFDFFNNWINRIKSEPLITSIVDMNRNNALSSGKFSEDKRYFITINGEQRGQYIEIEAGIDFGSGRPYITDAKISDHGYPASFGESIFSQNKDETGVEFNEDYWKFLK